MTQPLTRARTSCSSSSRMSHSAEQCFPVFSLTFKAHTDGLALVTGVHVAHTPQVIRESSLHPFQDLGGGMEKVLLVQQCGPGLLLARCQYQVSSASLKTPSHRAHKRILHPTLTDPLVQRSKLPCRSVSSLSSGFYFWHQSQKWMQLSRYKTQHTSVSLHHLTDVFVTHVK